MIDGVPSLVARSSRADAGEIEVQDHVSEEYELVRYERPYSRAFHLSNVESLLSRVRLKGCILDDGCGNGFLSEEVARRIGPADLLVGVDLSMGMLEKAKGRHTALVHADSEHLPFADHSFDTVIARSLLHHLPHPDDGIREIARVLKPGGEFVALDTHKTILSTWPRRIANRGEHFSEGHRNFSSSELRQAVSAHLEVEEVAYMGYVAYPLLGFPDLIDFGRFLPLEQLSSPLIELDDFLSRIPGLRALGWGIILKARRA
jgi:ubiquinone/menaquinone biosynthesis C-methylase UbiE